MKYLVRLRQLFSTCFELDLRSLAAFRIFMGLCLVTNLAQKLLYAKDLYSDWGIMPRNYWVQEYMSSWKISLLLANGEAWFQYAFIGATLLAALAFTLGYKTKISQIIVLIMLGSIQSRNYLVLSGADDLLRLSLFWSLLVPLDRHYAVRVINDDTNTQSISSIGSSLLIIQLLVMYLTTAVLKLHPIWTVDHTAIYYALNIDHFATPFALWFKNFYELGATLTLTTLIWEFVGPLLILSPFFTKQLRVFTACGFIFFHLGLALCLNLGTFPWVAISYWLVFLPGEWWDLIFKVPNMKPLQGFQNFLSLSTPTPQKVTSKKIETFEVVSLFLMCLVIYQNIANVSKGKILTPAQVRHVLHTLNLNQTWDMFAPYPIKNDGWFVLEGHFQNGETHDLLTNGPVTREKPTNVSSLYPTSEWRKFYLYLWDQGKRRILLPYARYMCRSQRAGSSALSTFKIIFMKETTPLPGRPFAPAVPTLLWSHDCFAK